MTSIKDFLYEIADDMGRPRDSMNAIAKIFEENWFDTVESIKDIDDDTLSKMKLPIRVIELIRKKLSKPIGMNIEQSKKVEPKKEDTKTMMVIEKADFKSVLKAFKKEILTSQKYVESLQILDKITMNIIKDQKNEQFRTLKLTNEKLKEKLFNYPSACEFLNKIKFSVKDQILQMDESSIDLSLLKQANVAILDEIGATNVNEFNPFSSSISSTSDMSTLDLIKGNDQSVYGFVEKLDELKKQRDMLVKPYIEHKDIKLFSLKPEESLQNFVNKREMIADDEETPEDEILFKKQALLWAKQLEESQQFSSKRKKEFEQLVKQPLFTECRIRIKFPNNTILEAKFSPKESIKNIVDVVKIHLIDSNWDFYLYQSPPVYKFTEHNWFKTLDEAGLVPNALLYFSLSDKGLESKIKDFIDISLLK